MAKDMVLTYFHVRILKFPLIHHSIPISASPRGPLQGVPLEGSDVVAIEVQDAGAEALEDETSKLKKKLQAGSPREMLCLLVK